MVCIVNTLHYRVKLNSFTCVVKRPPNERTGTERNKNVGKTI